MERKGTILNKAGMHPNKIPFNFKENWANLNASMTTE